MKPEIGWSKWGWERSYRILGAFMRRGRGNRWMAVIQMWITAIHRSFAYEVVAPSSIPSSIASASPSAISTACRLAHSRLLPTSSIWSRALYPTL